MTPDDRTRTVPEQGTAGGAGGAPSARRRDLLVAGSALAVGAIAIGSATLLRGAGDSAAQTVLLPRTRLAIAPRVAAARAVRAEAAAAPRAGRLARTTPLRQGATEWILRAHGIRWRSNGHCADRARTDCTSFDGLRWGTVRGLLAFQADSRCPLTVSGGTERGHAPGLYSHGTGYKIDVMPTGCTDRFVTRRYRPAGQRPSDRADLYRAPAGTVLAREKDHWDLLFQPAR
ncbi:hypothetical protein [Actinomadura parmotrematis]|uniref:Uncharacterized protein n=1 Tax=Actinomadura parmotrematis TaxID=2864039 RepID=A0ABS7FRB8_9ACTN|nr:hypothetical protein [Actinomadura parmotrematis]MBW8482861.1 hypothetical protein [Actinomadura parmotrematis]